MNGSCFELGFVDEILGLNPVFLNKYFLTGAKKDP